MKKEQESQVRRLQENLSTIRKLAGLTAEKLGEKIGVSKQTICNWESVSVTNKNGKEVVRFKSEMSRVHYLALRQVLDYEIKERREKAENNDTDEEENVTILEEAIYILLDSPDENPKEYIDIKEKMATVAKAAAGGVAGVALTAIYEGVVGAALAGALHNPLVTPFAAGAVLANKKTRGWLGNILKGGKNDSEDN